MWKESIKRWMSNTIREICHLQKDECIDDYIYCMENGKQAIDPECKVVITSYELLNKNIDEISQVEYKGKVLKYVRLYFLQIQSK